MTSRTPKSAETGTDAAPSTDATARATSAAAAALAESTWALLRRRMEAGASAPERLTVPCRFVVRDSVRRIGPPVVPLTVAPPRRPRPRRGRSPRRSDAAAP